MPSKQSKKKQAETKSDSVLETEDCRLRGAKVDCSICTACIKRESDAADEEDRQRAAEKKSSKETKKSAPLAGAVKKDKHKDRILLDLEKKRAKAENLVTLIKTLHDFIEG